MIVFFVLATLLVVLTIAAMVSSAIRQSSDTQSDQLQTNVDIAREHRQTLEAALRDGGIDQAGYDNEMSRLEESLATDLERQSAASGSNKSAWVVGALIALFLPIASGALYLQLGSPDAVDTDARHQLALAAQQSQQGENPPALDELLPNLEAKLEANPEDRDGWKLLGRSYLTLGNFSSAKNALMRAYDLDANDPDLLAMLAEASAMATQQAGEHASAIEQFVALRSTVLGNENAMASIDELIAVSRQAMGDTATASSSTSTENNSSSEPTEAGTASLTVSVALNEVAATNTSPQDTVFIYARASNGPPMPLAVARLSVADLPATVTLDDSMAMMPAMKLSQFPNVTVGARVSSTGNAIASTGDWFNEQEDIVVNQTDKVDLLIDQQEP